MSMTKRNPAFDRMMEEARLHDDLSHERYAEELYLNSRKGVMPKQENPEPKEDIFGLMGHLFNPNQNK